MKLQIAGWLVEVDCPDEVVAHLPNWQPFLALGANVQTASALCRVETGHVLQPEAVEPTLTNELEGRTLCLWLCSDCCIVRLTLHDEDYCYTLRANRDWSLVLTDWHYAGEASCRALDDFLMIAFIYSSAFHHTILMHASSVVCRNAGCAFIGASGVGKSTHSRLWLEHIPGTRLLNDDPAVLQVGMEVTVMTCAFYALFSCTEVFSASMRGVGNALKPAIITLCTTCVVRVLYLWLYGFAHASNGVIAFCYPLTWGISSVAFLLYYKFGRWMPHSALDHRQSASAGK